MREEDIEEISDILGENMLLNNLEYNVISNITGKTIEEIKEIENNGFFEIEWT